MGYKIAEDSYEEVEVREIGSGKYFEFHDEVFQRVNVSANFTVKMKPKDCEYPIYAVNLTTNTTCYFSELGDALVIPLYEVSPTVLTRRKP
jgi:hypothetical protein